MIIESRVFYIDPNGSNCNDGLTPETPFAGFEPINNMVLKPGDKVLLKRGGCWNELLIINGQGTPDNFIEIGSYGEGKLPVIRRNGLIHERCVRVNNPSYLKMSDMEVCDGGAGIVIFYDHCFHNESVYLSNITAHDFYGIYRASGEFSSREEWKSYRCDDRVGFSFGICVTGNDTVETRNERVLSDFRVSNCEIYHTGGGLGLDWCDHKNCDGTESGKNKFGNVLFENVYLHHNNIPDVSVSSLFIQCVTKAVFRNSTIDVGAGGAPWGAAAIHLQIAKNVLIDNVVIKNMPHTGTNDECGIDFETDTCVIKDCVFENNAGAGIEFLANKDGSSNPVSRNIHIIGCRFIHNNWAKVYPEAGQIQIVNWNVDNRPTGTICDCYFENPEGIASVNGDGFLDGMVQMGNRIGEHIEGSISCEKVACGV